MITPYFGEFLLHPFPLELSTNYCSHKCAYCFANLNKPDRKAAPQSIVNLLAEIDTRKTLAARLLQARYPVLLSNKVDPFAASNWKLTLQILELFAALKIPVGFQTKGGPGLREAMDLIGPSCWYFSITAADDETAKKIEPGAPTITERLEMMAMLRSAGHHVWAGVNPLCRQWIPDVKTFAKRLADAGIRHVWSELLHLSRDQVANMSDREKDALTPALIKEAMQRDFAPDAVTHAFDLIDACRENGIDFACKHWPEHSTCLDAYARCYPVRFPTMTEFTSHAWTTLKPGQEITFDEFCDYMLKNLPDLTMNELEHYIYCGSRKLAQQIVFVNPPTYREILQVIWDRRDHSMNPRKSRAFKSVVTGQDESGAKTFKHDAGGRRVLYFTARRLAASPKTSAAPTNPSDRHLPAFPRADVRGRPRGLFFECLLVPKAPFSARFRGQK
jgi:DNA repair photolyase